VPDAIRGDALTATGTYRALALVATPALVGGLVAATALPAAMLLAALVVSGTGAPAWWSTRKGQATRLVEAG
jgi:hypothetical protein